MKPAVLFLTSALLATHHFPVARGADEQLLEAEASALAAEFIATLKPQLKSALQAGGPAHAIEVCAKQAPRIADALSEQSGWSVRRVSLKSRNASRAVPDAWEQEVLESFDRLLAAGEQPAALQHSETVQGHFRYMRAQPVEGVCLLCHGGELSPEVQATLETYYPDDTATGYQLGQIRGAISLAKPL